MDKKPYIVGLTGGIACGKTTATDYLKTLGAAIVDADEESRAVTGPGGDALGAIRETFGSEVFTAQGELDRRALGKIVFADARSRHALEAIIHPMVQRRMLNKVSDAAKAGEKVVFLSVPLLFESGMDVLCDETWVIALERETQIDRLMARDSLDRAEAERRVDCQMALSDKTARADVVVRNGRQVEQMKQDLNNLYRDLCRRVS